MTLGVAGSMKPSPSILALVTDAFGGQGGIAQYNRDLLSALASPEGGAASITVLPRHASDSASPPDFIRQAAPRRGRVAYSLIALATALTRPYGIIYCGHLFMAPLAALIAKLKGAKLLIQAHGIEAWERSPRLRRAALEAADLVLCVSRFTRARVLDWAVIAPERMLVLPNTVGDTFTPGDGASLRATLGLESKLVLLTVGRMDSRERYKGHDLVIAALPSLIANGHDATYVIIGDGDDHPRLEALASGAGLSERVRFLGMMECERLIEAYRMADLFVMPSTGEGFGIAFLEALACGTPALGLNVAGARDALADGELGTLACASDLAASIDRLFAQTPTDGHALARAVRARFGREKFHVQAKLAIERLAETA